MQNGPASIPPTERERAIQAVTLGVLLGVVMALVARLAWRPPVG